MTTDQGGKGAAQGHHAPVPSRVFVSYSRHDRDRVVPVVERLRELGVDPWWDRDQRGGERWWDRILTEIRDCGALVLVLSDASRRSVACGAETEYATALGKPILPIAIEPITPELRTGIAQFEIVDYSQADEGAAFALVRALQGLSPSGSLPHPLPEPPAQPLSYLAGLMEAVSSPASLSDDEQRDILWQLQQGTRSNDPDERGGTYRVLSALESRPDLTATALQQISAIRSRPDERAHQGGTFEQLLPLNRPMPVYSDLAERLLAPADGDPDPVVPHVLSVTAGYAYAGGQMLGMRLGQMGLDGNRCRTVAAQAEPMLIKSSAHFVQSHDGRVVILCFQGPEPAEASEWLTTRDPYGEQVALSVPGAEGQFGVHGCVYRNISVVKYQVLDLLRRAVARQSLADDTAEVDEQMDALYLTGHGLGGAMAALFAIKLAIEPDFSEIFKTLRWVCTFGQPMFCSPELAYALDEHSVLSRRVLRYVYQDDYAPHLPTQDVGDYGHFGRQLRYKGSGWTIAEEPSQTTNIGLLRPFQRLSHFSMSDHLPHHYVAALTPRGVPTEFGDAVYAS